MTAMSGKQLGMGNFTGRTDNTQENTKQEDLLIQEYCIPAKMSNLFLPRCQKWSRAFKRNTRRYGQLCGPTSSSCRDLQLLELEYRRENYKSP